MTVQPPPRFDVFLSYCRADKKRVQSVQMALEQLKVRVWRDTGQIVPGDIWTKNVETGLRESDCVVLFNSQNALASEWVLREWTAALTLHKRIIPVRLDDADLPALLTTTESVDFHDSGQLEVTARQIVRGIRGADITPSALEPEVLSNSSVIGQDVAILGRMIQSEWNNERNLSLARWSAAFFGLLAITSVMIWSDAMQAGWIAMLMIASLATFGTIVWFITPRLQDSQTTVKRLTSIKDGIELYCPKQQACVEFRTALEKILKESAGIQEILR